MGIYNINMYKRFEAEAIRKGLADNKVVIIYGARQVGKTTLAQQIASDYSSHIYLNCDEPEIVQSLSDKSSLELKALIGNNELVIIDEGQRVKNIGITLKLLHDTYPDLNIIATGSSSFDLANQITEPLTGRSVEILLFPLSITEIAQNNTELRSIAKIMMLRGSYPAIWQDSAEQAYKRLTLLANNYVYKDTFAPKIIYDQTILNNLLRLLAYQIGNEVSYGELANSLDITKETVKRYVDLLEKAFIIFRRNQYRHNQRVEVGRLRKIYFYDLGIRNAVINNFQPLESRDDIGQLWENICVTERLKYHARKESRVNSFYWRGTDQREIDIIEVKDGELFAYECKYNIKKLPKLPLAFSKMYKAKDYKIINQDSLLDWI